MCHSYISNYTKPALKTSGKIQHFLSEIKLFTTCGNLVCTKKQNTCCANYLDIFGVQRFFLPVVITDCFQDLEIMQDDKILKDNKPSLEIYASYYLRDFCFKKVSCLKSFSSFLTDYIIACVSRL